eukprot:TRINITY_DN48991_c0_g1_i1.p1 TRINITY_DN48991_c0_g1~~TRINITY_DN48991_c0_g1_i1.p1  ORF type:complete len:576 (-),score=96.31 TRINITY_DN48991_c0_g1_i1:35-1762(-)
MYWSVAFRDNTKQFTIWGGTAAVAATACGACTAWFLLAKFDWISFVQGPWRALLRAPLRGATVAGSVSSVTRHGECSVSENKEETPSTTDVAAEDDVGDSADLEDLASAEARPPLLGAGEVQRARRQEDSSVGNGGSESEAHLPGRQRVHVMTFGCPHNQSDGEYMVGQLQDYGFTMVKSVEDCDICVVNSCTVKTPTEAKGINVVEKARSSGKRVVLAGCVPSGDNKLANSMEDVSMLDVSQLDRIVDVVEEAAKGHAVKILQKRSQLSMLSLPKVRRDRLSEIITINAGCLGNCTYCKTKLARGTVVSYPIEEIVERAREVAREGVRHIELASEDMGAYGVDIGTNIVELLRRLSDSLPPGVMLRTGMTNPPYILHHIDGIIEVLKRPNVYAFMHIPVQSGSDAVLTAMRREYTIAEFCYLCDRLKEAIPDIFLMTDIICGFPAESAEDWLATMDLCKRYKFHGVYQNKFYARANTPAARMKQLKPRFGLERYKELTELTMSYNRNEGLAGSEVRAWFTGTDKERGQTIGRTKAFAKVVVPRDDSLLGESATVQILETSQYHAEGVILAASGS